MRVMQNVRVSEWSKPREVSQRRRVSLLTVYRAIDAGTLKASRLGPKLWRIHRDDEAQWAGEST